MIENPHKLPPQELLKQLYTTKDGLTQKEAEERLKKTGENILTIKKSESIIKKYLKQFTNFFAILLIIGSLLAFLAEYLAPGDGNLYIGIALLIVVILNATFTFIQEYQSEKIMESFKKMLPEMVNVLRDNEWKNIEAKYLVEGDIISISEGDKIPADCRLIEENELKVDNSSITGESEPQLRKLECTHENILESRNMLFSGTLVQSGDGMAVVYSRGMDTQIGKIISLTKETKTVETPLRKELKHFIKIISTIAITLGIVFFFVSLLVGKQLIGSIIFAIGIIVANVPEGLLPTVTLSLSMASKRMAKKNALVKNLESVETLGSTTIICTDKTGTLTKNEMSVVSLYLNEKLYTVDKDKIEELPEITQILTGMTLCNNAKFEGGKYLGDPTEVALLNMSSRYLDISKTNHQFKRVHESPFDSKTKRMITTNIDDGNLVAYMKGAPEVILEKCSKIKIGEQIFSLDKKRKEDILKTYEKLASQGQRVLAFSFKHTKLQKTIEHDFTFIGLVSMMDPPRDDIKSAIEKCKTAGIKVVMVTGDYSLTAKAIGQKVGLIQDEANIVLGEELEKMSDFELQEILKKDNLIFARTSPKHKLRIVKNFQAIKEIVTVTGDGVNDAPALKNADMGVAMGKSGTEVAREAADMVLMDDNFATIVTAVEEGRTIFANIKKFIAYILTSNIPEILPFIAFVLLGIPLPLSIILILAIDLGTDLIPALGLAAEKPEADVMKKKPRSRNERLLTKNLLFMSYGIVGMIQAAAGFFSFFYILFAGGWIWGQDLALTDPLYMKAVTGFFASIIICQIADVFICKTRKQSLFSAGFFKNKLILLGIATELTLLALITYIPILNEFFSTQPLSMFELSLSVPFALLILFGDELRKLLLRHKNPFVIKYLKW